MLVAPFVGIISQLGDSRYRALYLPLLMPDINRVEFDLCDIAFFKIDKAVGNLT